MHFVILHTAFGIVGINSLKATLNKPACVAHRGCGRFAALQILAMAPPCLWAA